MALWVCRPGKVMPASDLTGDLIEVRSHGIIFKDC